MGQTTAAGRPPFRIAGRPDGSCSEDGWIVGTSLHGLLSDARFRRAVLTALARRKRMPLAPAIRSTDPIDRLAHALERAFDIPTLEAIIWPSARSENRPGLKRTPLHPVTQFDRFV